MKPASFDLIVAASVDETTETLSAAAGDGKILAGGLSLGPLLNLRMARPRVLVDINRIPGLNGIDADENRIDVGALVRHEDMRMQSQNRLAAEVSRWIGHGAIQFRGTVCGSVAHADPSAEWPCISVACDAEIRVSGFGTQRTLAPTAMFQGALQTDLRYDEMVTSISLRNPTRWGFSEFARRKGDFAMALAVVAEIDGMWRVVIGGVAPTPSRITEAEMVLNEKGLTEKAKLEVSKIVASKVNPTADLHGTSEYRRALSVQVVLKALENIA